MYLHVQRRKKKPDLEGNLRDKYLNQALNLLYVCADVIAYAAHVPSYADTWGWVMASDRPFPEISPRGLDVLIKQRIKGDLRYMDGETLVAMRSLNKTVRKRLESETHVYSEEIA